MHILLISAFYPPYVVGGWEQLVQDINHSLQKRGHSTLVLTSNYGVPLESGVEPGVERKLWLESDLFSYRPLDFFLKHRPRLERNLLVTRQTIEQFNPDVIFIHVMWNLTRGIAWVSEQLRPGRVVYYIANDWPYAVDPHRAYWLDPAYRGGRKIVKQLLAPFALQILNRKSEAFPLRFEHVLCVSQAIREDLAQRAGIPVENMQVVYNGVETELFLPSDSPACKNGHLALLYAGSLVPHKGVHTAIEAMALLAKQPELEQLSLTLVGSGHPDYEAHLRKRVAEAGLTERVHFQQRVSRHEMPALLQKFDVLVFPSIWKEPLARMTQEAMAAGLVVVGTPTGGTPEILKDGETGLTFEPEDAEGLAERLELLYRDPEFRTKLAKRARQTVLEKFDFQRMIDEIQDYLAILLR